MSESKAHKKHANLTKPQLGKWGRCEFAILGTTCGEIQTFAKQLAEHLAHLNVAYIDESHQQQTEPTGFHTQSTKQSKQWSHIQSQLSNDYQNKLTFNSTDVQLINGNHFEADQQIVFIDDKKKDSLHKKLNRITNLKIVVKQSNDQEIYSFLTPYMQANTVVVSREDIRQIGEVIIQEKNKNSSINGLILAGGKSTRMGTDKGKINYHGMSQVEYLNLLLKPYCDEVYVSLRPEQESEYSVPSIEDSYQGFGPISGILSAFKHNPNAAWLTVATDLPMIADKSIKDLIQRRNPTKIASCYKQSQSEFPDPLFTIWEPKAYLTLLSFLSLGYSCPRKVLINSDVNVLPIEDDQILLNVNDPETMKLAKSLLA